MIHILRSQDRGHAEHGWLESYHSFSFADYFNPDYMGFRTLRVINEDWVQPGKGFPTHAHRDMEIITYVLEGELEHKDSMGNGSIIAAGDIQYMSAGRGVSHSEFNHSAQSLVHLLQIWIMPNETAAIPRYGQTHFAREEKLGRLRLVVSPQGSDGSIAIRQDAKLYASVLDARQSVSLSLEAKRFAWVHVVSGELQLNNERLQGGDAAAISDLTQLNFTGLSDATEFLLFDLN
jgi:redox-sensitive bicupin YhaK (pirin superfamily)